MDTTQRTVSLSRGKGKGLFRSVLPAFFLMLLLGICLLFGASLLLSRLPDPAKGIRLIGPALPALCAFTGGFTAGRREKNMGAVMGLCTGLLFVLFLLVLSTFTGSDSKLAVRILSYALLLLLATLGGAAGSAGGTKRKRRKRR
jgi:putative membrane protein (TIGR04086 family)